MRAPGGRDAFGLRRFHGGELIAQLHHDALGRFASHTGNAGEAHEIARSDRGQQLFDVHSRKNLERQRRPDSGSGDQQLEELLFARGQKAVQGDGVFAQVGMDQERDVRAEIAEGVPKKVESGMETW